MSDQGSDDGFVDEGQEMDEEQFAEYQHYMAQMAKMKTKMMPLVRYLQRQGLKIKHASFQNEKLDYFRVDELNTLVEQKKQAIEGHPVLSELIKDLPNCVGYFKRLKNQPKMKYPDRLQPSEQDHGKFAAFPFDITESKRYLVVLIIAAVIAVVLFPLWPYTLKYVLWLVSLYLLTGLLVLIGIRTIAYLIFAIFGFSFWIFPNLFGDYGIIQSFKPFYSVSRWQTGIFSIICRLVCFCIICYYGYHIYKDPSFLLQNFEISKTAFGDVHDWGVSKIKGQHGNFSQRALENLDLILNKTADAGENITAEQL